MRYNRGRKPPNKRFKFFLLLLGIIVFFFLTLLIFGSSSWDGGRRLSFVINTDPTVVFTLEPHTKRAVVIVFPSNTLLEVPFGYKTYPAASIYRLGELDDKRNGGILFTKTIENTIGLYVDGYFSFSDIPIPIDIINDQRVKEMKESYFNFIGAIRHIHDLIGYITKWQTNFSFLDQYKIWLALRKIRSDRIEVIDLDAISVLSDDILADGTKVKKIDIDKFDVIIADKFEDKLIRSENITIEVNNASGKDRLASQFARILTLRGSNVIMKSTDEDIQRQRCTLVVSQDKFLKSIIVAFLKDAYVCTINNNRQSQLTSDMKIILGEEFYQ